RRRFLPPLASAARNSSLSGRRDKTHVIAPRCISFCSAAQDFSVFCTHADPQKTLNSGEHFEHTCPSSRNGVRRKPEPTKEMKNNESDASLQKNTKPTTSHRTGAGSVDGRSGSRNARVQFFRYTARDGHLSGGLARLDVQGSPGLESQV